MNGLILNGVGRAMTVKISDSYFEIMTLDGEETYVGIPAFCQEQSGFGLMYAEVLSALLVMSRRKVVFYVLTDNTEFYSELVDRLKVPDDMRLAVVYTEDHLYIKEETQIGGDHMEWKPVSVVTNHESVTAK